MNTLEGCHLRYDAEHNRKKVAATRREKATAGMVPLFEGGA